MFNVALSEDDAVNEMKTKMLKINKKKQLSRTTIIQNKKGEYVL
jgi:hypothetical protein